MSQFVPNTYVAIFRDGTIPDGADAWGNPVPPTTPTADQADAKDRPALLTELRQMTAEPTSGREDVTHLYQLRLRPGAVAFEISTQDRVLDQRSGRYFAVDETPEPANVVQRPDLRYVLRRVS